MRVNSTPVLYPYPGQYGGTRRSEWRQYLLAKLAPLLFIVFFSTISSNIYSQEVAAWGDGDVTWSGSTLNDLRSDYFQGEVIPFGFKTTPLQNGTSYTFNIAYDYYNNSGNKNAGGYAYITTYNISRTPPPLTGGSAPVIDNSFTGTGSLGAFYSQDADITDVSAPTGTDTKTVSVTFTYTGTSGGTAYIYWGMYLSKTGTVPDQGNGTPTNGAGHWPGGSLALVVSSSDVGGGNVGNNPGAGGVVDGIISGQKYSDLDKNGAKNGTESGLQGWTIYIDNDSSGTLTAGDISTTTDADGNYAFHDLLPRSYHYYVREVNQTDWTQTQPGSAASYQYALDITAAIPEVPDKLFGNFICATPTPTITPLTATICAGDFATLTSSSSTGNQWYDNGVLISGATNSTYNATGVGPYTVTVTFLGCPSTSDPVTVTVNQPSTAPSGATASVSPICNGGSSVLTPTGGTLGTGASYKWYTDNTFTTPAPGTPNATTGALTVSPTSTTTYYVRIEGTTSPCTDPSGSTSVQVVVNQPINVTSPPTDQTVTYPDNATFSITASNVVSYQWQQKTTASGAAFGDLGGETGSSLTLTSPGVSMSGYRYKVNLAPNSPCSPESREATLTVNPRQLCLTYDGLTFGTTNTSRCYVENMGFGVGVIRLILTVVGTPPGNLATAEVKISIAGGNVADQTATYVAASGVNPAYYYYDWTVPCPAFNSNATSEIFEITWSVGGNYTSTGCNETEALITISGPSSDFTTGGGYIFNNKSKGTIGLLNNDGTPKNSAETPSKNNYGFNLKWGNNNKNLLGNFNTIIRQGGRQYQVKSNKPTFLATKARPDLAYIVNGKTITPYEAYMTYENAVFKDLTGLATNNCAGSVIPGCSQGNPANIVYLRIIDMGEPNSGATIGTINRIDSISMLIRWPNGTVFYSSEAYTITNNPAVIKLIPIVKGNVQVHVAAAKPSTLRDVQGATTALNQMFELKATPNPTHSYFTVQLPNAVNTGVNLRVMDVLGRVVESKQNLPAGQTLRIGSTYRPGIYIIEVTQGNLVKQLKLVKQ
jgi:hypothetical protein